MTKPLIRLMLPQHGQPNIAMSTELSATKLLTVPLIASEQDSDFGIEDGNTGVGGGKRTCRRSSLSMLLKTPASTVHYYWRKFDDAVMRPIFGGRGFAPVLG